MAQVLNPANIRQMRDFLEIFNKVTENCFNHCVVSFFERDVSHQENVCVDRCVTKFLRGSHVAMNTYVEMQPKMVERRIQEFNEMVEKSEVKTEAKTEE